MSALPKDNLITASAVADILGVAVRTVYTLPIPCYYIGRAVLYTHHAPRRYWLIA
jgi:hypothetical protein